MELTNEEKIQIIKSHIRNIVYSAYNVEVSLMAENAVDSPNSDYVANLNKEAEDLNDKITVLEEELARLEAI